jgi:hypothetical protein
MFLVRDDDYFQTAVGQTTRDLACLALWTCDSTSRGFPCCPCKRRDLGDLGILILLIVVLGARYEAVTTSSQANCIHAQISVLLYEALVAGSLLHFPVHMDSWRYKEW